jgi:hypothetical protein
MISQASAYFGKDITLLFTLSFSFIILLKSIQVLLNKEDSLVIFFFITIKGFDTETFHHSSRESKFAQCLSLNIFNPSFIHFVLKKAFIKIAVACQQLFFPVVHNSFSHLLVNQFQNSCDRFSSFSVIFSYVFSIFSSFSSLEPCISNIFQ